MKIVETDNGVQIEFGNKLNNKIKVLFSFEAIGGILAVVFGVFLVLSAMNSHNGNGYFDYLFSYAMIIIGAIFFWRYFSRISNKETIFINADTLKIIISSINRKVATEYEISKISDLKYRGKAVKTDHPLKGQSYDYFGFETQELVIAEVHNEGNLSFVYDDKIVCFGRNVYSWDAVEINEILHKITKGHLQIANLPEEMDEEEYLQQAG